MNEYKKSNSYIRFGGEIPIGSDPISKNPSLINDDVLLFSHGRAALSWFLEFRGPFSNALICNYTCPTVPFFFKRYDIKVNYFDYLEENITSHLEIGSGKVLVLLPAPFGMSPWIDPKQLAHDLGSRFSVIVDAAQSAFGHKEFSLPPGGAILSCPRKTLAIPDGAILKISNLEEYDKQYVNNLYEATESVLKKQEARLIFSKKDISSELQGLALARESETALPDKACKMSKISQRHIQLVDAKEYKRKRTINALTLRETLPSLESLLPNTYGTPFNWPFMLKNREKIIKKLEEKRIFATPLWPDIVTDDQKWPQAYRMSRELVALPIDQRYTKEDMILMGDMVKKCL